MSKLNVFDCDDCRECYMRRVFEQGYAWCKLYMIYCPANGCELGVNKDALNIHD